MKRTISLYGGASQQGMVTPLVDVVFNLMITMFVFLMIYVVVVVPEPPSYVKIVTKSLPPAAVALPYHAGFGATGGSGVYRWWLGGAADLTCTDTNGGATVVNTPQTCIFSVPGTCELHLNTASGLIEDGRFFAGAILDGADAATINLEVVVLDVGAFTAAPRGRIEKWGEIDVDFVDEEPLTPTAVSAEVLPGSAPTASRGVHKNYVVAVRRMLKIEVTRKHLPFDPDHTPLVMTSGPKTVFASDSPIDLKCCVSGGLPPYEYRTIGLPGELSFDESRGRIVKASADEKVPEGIYRFDVEIKDAQTAREDWDGARRQVDSRGHPYLKQTIEIQIVEYKSLSDATFTAPPYGRQGQPVDIAVIAAGGSGRRSYSAVELPPGLTIDTSTGRITGSSSQTGQFNFVVNITDEDHILDKLSTAVAQLQGWRVIPPAPQPRILGDGERD